MAAIHEAVSPLVALGFESSYQNDGDAFEEDWQQGTVTHLFPFSKGPNVLTVLSHPSLLWIQVCKTVGY